MIISGNSSPSDYQLSPALKQKLGGHEFKDDRELGRVVTPEKDRYQRGTATFLSRYDVSVLLGAM